MRVKIGPYTEWFGPYQMADKVFFWLDKYPEPEDENRPIYKLHEWLGEFLAGKDKHDTWLHKFCVWINEHKHRKVQVKLDSYDYWNAGHTIALVALPVLKALQENKHGSAAIDLSDVPETLWPKQLAGPNNQYTDDTVHERWNWALAEMIWAFEQEVNEDDESQFYDHSLAKEDDDLTTQIDKIKVDREGLEAHQQRKANGFRLFGKYFQALWD